MTVYELIGKLRHAYREGNDFLHCEIEEILICNDDFDDGIEIVIDGIGHVISEETPLFCEE